MPCALNNLSKEMSFDLIRSVLFEKRLSCVFIGIQFLSAATMWRVLRILKSCRETTTNFRSKLRLNASKIIFLPGALEMLFKEISLDPNVAVSPEKHANLVNITQHFRN